MKPLSSEICIPLENNVTFYAFPYVTQRRAICFCSLAYAENCFMGGFIQWHMLVIGIWCALFVTSQLDVIFLFPDQRLGEVCYVSLH